MYEEENIEISNQAFDQKNEKRKKKKRRGKTSSSEDNEIQPENALPTLSSILTGAVECNLPKIDEPKQTREINKEESQYSQQRPTRLRGRNLREEKRENNVDQNFEKKKEKSKPYSYIMPLGNVNKPINQQITYDPEEIPEKEDYIDEKEKNDLRLTMNKYFKRSNPIEDDKKNDLKEDNNGTIPSKDINPNDLFKMDEDDGEIDYLPGQKAYDLSVFLQSHKFIKNNENFDKKFVELVKRKIIRFERNLLNLVENDKFFIFYELQVCEQTNLCLTEIVTLNAIKSVFQSFPFVHLIIMLSDEDFYNKNYMKHDSTFIKELSQDKLVNILIYLNLDSENEKRVHAFSTKYFKRRNKEFEREKNVLKELLNKPRLRKLFNLTSKDDEKNDLLLDYPCYLAAATNPLIYKNYIPEITNDYTCLIINSIFFMNRYQLCFDAAKILSFNEPAVIALKIVPPLKGVNGREAFSDIDEENTILSSDENISLNRKLNDIAHAEDEDRNQNLDICCQYLAFLEEDNDNYDDMMKRYQTKIINPTELKKKVYHLIRDMLQIYKEKEINNIDTNKIMIN